MSAPGHQCTGCGDEARLGRRSFLATMTAGVVLALAGCSNGTRSVVNGLGLANSDPASDYPHAPVADAARVAEDLGGAAPVLLDQIPPAHPGTPLIVSRGPRGTNQIALTIDDGYCGPCIEKYVAFAQSSGIHITFNPNGAFGALWTPQLVDVVRPMIANQQVQIGNHTFSHPNLTTLSTGAISSELERNENWIQQTFGITSRPWFRPPYGDYDNRVEQTAGELGYTNVLMWNGSFGDSTAISPQQLLGLAEKYLTPGTIMLGHLNHPTILSLFGRIEQIIAERKLAPVTLDEMFGTSRMVG